MSWTHLESGKVNDKRLDLYQDGSDYMIRVDGFELMNSCWHRSEAELARIAGWCLPKLNPQILIGGLGLGYTLAAFLEEFNDKAQYTVSEQSLDVLNWYNKFYKKIVLREFDDSSVRFINMDIQDVINNSNSYDLIILDVDNGPDPISGGRNGELYTLTGLQKIKSKLREGGALLLWSAFQAPEFEGLARSAGYHVSCYPVNVGLRDHKHFIYCCQFLKNNVLENHQFFQAASYDHYARDYDDDVEFIKTWLGDSQTVLEIGVGTGRLALPLSEGREFYCGIDTSAPMLHQLVKNKKNKKIYIDQKNMFDFTLNKQFESIIYPFRVLSYASCDQDIISTLNRTASHLKPGGRVLLNMIDFSEEFITNWHNRSVSYDFLGPDNKMWKKVDIMQFTEMTMTRIIQFYCEGTFISENRDNLIWVKAVHLASLCTRVGLKVTNIWPAYEFKTYTGRGEYVLEARI